MLTETTALYLPLAAVLVIYLARMIELGTKRNVIRGPVREKLSFQLFWVVGTSIWIGSIIEYFVRHHRLDWPWFIAGCACGISSFVIRRQAIAALGKFWSLHVEIRDAHQFVQNGPFRFVRHPAYFSMLLELLAVSLILKAYIMLCLVPLLYFPVLAFRLRLEEAALIEKFGPAYAEYRRSTPALLPYKWPRNL
jgi:protein-S-isoprenylcysteine O-methyltransferase Ste14